MVFIELHWVPSSIAALLVIYMVLFKPKKHYDLVAGAMAFFAVLGLIGYIVGGAKMGFGFDQHSIHMLFGWGAFISSMIVWGYFNAFKLHRKKKWAKKRKIFVGLGKVAMIFAIVSLVGGFMMFAGTNVPENIPQDQVVVSVVPSAVLTEIEATEYLGVALTPVWEQGTNAIEGTQYIDRESYRLEVTGLVDNELSVSYDELLALPAYAEVAYMPCVEGWGFTAKWTGFRVMDLLDNAAGAHGTFVMFYSADGYSTGMDIQYLEENNILLAYGINDITLPAERGFPLQLVAKSKYGYKWGKWITRIDVGDEELKGFWEQRGYSNNAAVGGPAFE